MWEQRYANSLAKLRLHARIIRINPSPPLVVTKRLHSICEQEQLRSERRALNLLAEICQGDLRSCLNALQVGTYLNSFTPASYGTYLREIVYEDEIEWR